MKTRTRLRLTYHMRPSEFHARDSIIISFEVETSAQNDAEKMDVLEYMTPATGFCAYSCFDGLVDEGP